MSLTVNNLNQYSSIATSNDLVSANELESITRELFAAAPSTQSTNKTSSDLISKLSFTKTESANNGLALFGANAELSAEKLQQVAANKSGYNVTLTENALNSINALNTQAAKLQTTSYSKQMDGKVYVPAQNTDLSDKKPALESQNSNISIEIGNMNKDKRGSNPFCVAAKNEQRQENNDNINIFANA